MFLASVLVVSFALAGGVASAEVPLKTDRVDVFQLKSITKKRRFEITPSFSVSMNDAFVHTLLLGGALTFHIAEGFAFEATGGYAFTFDSQASISLRDGVDPNQPGKVVKPQVSKTFFNVFGHFVWSPLVGKFALGRRVVDFDLFLLGGAGFVLTNRGGRAAASFGFGWRVFLAKWAAIRFDVRDAIYGQELLGVTTLTHNVFVTVGLSFLLPTEPIYTFDREP
jgi:outer membrane beta-barrel protein